VTTNTVRDAFPDINDVGTMVWTHDADFWGGGTIVLYENAVLTELAPGADASINKAGHVALTRFTGDGCEGADANIFFYDGQQIKQLTENDLSNQGQVLNGSDEVVWTRYAFCPDPWESDIRLWHSGATHVLPTVQEEVQVPDINESGTVAWAGTGIEVWSPDTGTCMLTDWGRNPRLNNRGDIAFLRWHDDSSTWQVWLYRGGEFVQLTFPPFRCTDSDINDWGEVVFKVGQYPDGDISLMRRLRSGEADFDGDIDLDDATVLHDCLTGPGDFDRLCDCRFLDLDHDRDVDLADFARFQQAYGEP